MPKCVKCGYENKWRSKECANCGTRLFMGMSVMEMTKLNGFQKFAVFIVKYIFLFVEIYFLWKCFSVLFNLKNDIVGSIFSFICLLISYAPIIFIIYFSVRLFDFMLKNSNHPDNIDFKERQNKDNNYDKNM